MSSVRHNATLHIECDRSRAKLTDRQTDNKRKHDPGTTQLTQCRTVAGEWDIGAANGLATEAEEGQSGQHTHAQTLLRQMHEVARLLPQLALDHLRRAERPARACGMKNNSRVSTTELL
jgi:hypothetical protein